MMDFNKVEQLEGCTIFLFGATGDLAKRKLYPALYSLYKEKKLTNFAVVGMARSPRTDAQFRENVKDSIEEFSRYKKANQDDWADFADRFYYNALDSADAAGFEMLRTKAEELEDKHALTGNRLYYLALAPELFGTVTSQLKDAGFLNSSGWNRLVIEKPFGYDHESAAKLNDEIRSAFEEHEIYRIDHYLGKEMVQNIEVIRFANAFFEPLWNRDHIANIQITLSETVGVEDRGGYYDHAGALRDMGQNHMLQMIAMMAMEPPSRLNPEDIRDEKVKVLRSLRAYETVEEVRENVIRAQYSEGTSDGKLMPSYRAEDKVDPVSETETFFAAKVFVDNFRWAGVPFYVRTGKRLPAKSTEVVVEFKNLPERVHFTNSAKLEPNLLVFRVQPMEGIYIKFNGKQPGGGSQIIPIAMDFCQSCQVGLNTPEAYERLLHDAILGDSTYFTRWDEVSYAWKFVDNIQKAWAQNDNDLLFYESGTWGPKEASEMLEQDGFRWWPVQGQDEGEITWVMPQV